MTRLFLWVVALVFAGCASAPVRAQQASNVVADYCSPGPFIVSFSWGSAELDAEGAKILEVTLEDWRRCEQLGAPVAFALDGHRDAGEPAEVSSARAGAIRTYLLGHGVTEARLRRFDCASRDPRFKPNPPIGEPRNARAEITFGPMERSRLLATPECIIEPKDAAGTR